MPLAEEHPILHFLVPKNPTQVKFFPGKKKNFFFPDFLKIDLSLVKTTKFWVRKTAF